MTPRTDGQASLWVGKSVRVFGTFFAQKSVQGQDSLNTIGCPSANGKRHLVEEIRPLLLLHQDSD